MAKRDPNVFGDDAVSRRQTFQEATAPSPIRGTSNAVKPRELTPAEQNVARTDFTRPSTARPRPVDEEGIPYLDNKDMGAVLNTHPDTAKKQGYNYGIPQYKERKGGVNQTSTFNTSRTWYKLSEVVDYLHGLGEPHRATHERFKSDLDSYRKDIALRRRSGEKVPTLLDNDSMLDNLYHFPKGRVITPTEFTPTGVGTGESYSSDVETALKQGHGYHMRGKYPYTGRKN